jgi:hypothetical protein
MKRDIFQMNQPEIRFTGNAVHDCLCGRYTAPREYVSFDKINTVFMFVKNVVRDGYGLERHHTVRFQKITAAVEERIQILMPDSFNHLD